MNNQNDLIAEILTIAGELDGEVERLTTYDSTGRQSKKIVIEYDVKQNKR